MKQLVYAFLLMTIFASCTYNSVTLLSEEELEWMDVYSSGDTVLFSAADGGIDTMIVSRTVDNLPDKFGLHCFTDYHGRGSYNNIIFHKGDHFDCLFIIRKGYNNLTYFITRFEDRFSNPDDETLQPSDTTKVIVKGRIYDDALTIDDSNSFISENTMTNCEYFIWSKSKGLLEYKYLNGEVYTFYKKLPYKK